VALHACKCLKLDTRANSFVSLSVLSTVSPVEVAVFYVQHTLMMGVIVCRMACGARWMLRDVWWNVVGYVIICCYHYWFLAPVG
jgi:TMEM164 family